MIHLRCTPPRAVPRRREPKYPTCAALGLAFALSSCGGAAADSRHVYEFASPTPPSTASAGFSRYGPTAPASPASAAPAASALPEPMMLGEVDGPFTPGP